MPDLSKEDLIFHLFSKYLTAEERMDLEKRIKDSPTAVEEAGKLKEEIDAMLADNNRERAQVMDNLLKYLNGEITTLNETEFSKFLDDYDGLRFIYQRLKRDPSSDETKTMKYPIPETLTQNVRKVVSAHTKELRGSEAGKSIKHKLDEFVNKIILILAPAPEPAFLGSEVAGAAQVNISKEGLIVDVGESDRLVKIFSLDDEELEKRISNENGIVEFKGFQPFTYKIMVQGFEIKQVVSAI